MIPNSFINLFRVCQLRRSKAAKTAESNCPGENRHHSTLKQFFTFRAKRPGNRLEGRRFVGCKTAEYKTADGDVFSFGFPAPDSENIVGKFKKCFRIVGCDRIKLLHALAESGLRISKRHFCESYDPESDQCEGCGLIETEKEREYAA